VAGALVAALSTAPHAAAQRPLQDEQAARAIVLQALRDGAATRAGLTAAPASGDDGGFVVAGEGFSLQVSGQLQLRSNLVVRPEARAGEDDFVPGLQLRRTRVFFDGELFDGALAFKTTISMGADGQAGLSTGQIEAPISEGLTLRAGQFKLPFLLEESMSSKRQLAVDRSVMNRAFSQRRSQGVALDVQLGDRSGASVAFSDGFDSQNTDLDRSPADWALTGRVQTAAVGSLRAARQFSGFPGDEEALLLGAAAHAQGKGADRLYACTLDALARGDGWSFFAAGVVRFVQEQDLDALDVGALVQGGLFVDEGLELFARYDLLLPDRSETGDASLQTLTIGFNRYFHSHALKLTVDAQLLFGDLERSRLFDGSTSVAALPGAGGDIQLALRAQVQLLF